MYPTVQEQLSSLGLSSLTLLLTGLGVHVLARLLGMRNPGWTFPDARRAALPALVMVAIWIVLLVVVIAMFSRPNVAPVPAPAAPHYDFGRTVNQAVVYLILVAPALLIMWRRHEPPASAGVTRRNLFGALVVGLAVAIVSVVTSSGIQALTRGLDSSQLWALPYFAVVGFAEEFLFRGYLQTRLVAWLGQRFGWLLASTIMAMMHIGQRVAVQGLTSPEAILSSALLIPISLFMGYVMLRTGNVVAPGICHTFADWVGVLS